MYVYRAYNLCIHSEIELPELLPWDGIADLTIHIHQGSSTSLEKKLYPSFCGQLEGIGSFYIQQGKTIIIEPDVSDIAQLRPTVLGPALSVALRQRGMLVLHASCVNINHQAIAFMGDSGWGKSTLAAAFHRQGHPLLTDDVMALKADGLGPLVMPGFPQIKLWPDAAESFGHQPGQLPTIYPNAPKLSYRFDHGFQQEPLPLTHLYVLRKGTPEGPLCQIKSLSHRAAFLELLRHTREMLGMQDADIQKAHFHQCNALLQSVNISYLIRRPQLNDLADLVGHIKRDILAPSDAIAS